MVQFDPAQAKVQQMLDAVSGLGYRPSQDGAVRVSIDGPAATIEAGLKAATLAPGADGKVEVTLTPKGGARLKGAKVALEGDEVVTTAKAETSVTEEVAAVKKVEVPVSAGKDAKPGDRTVTVRVTFTARDGEQPTTVELRVPITVK